MSGESISAAGIEAGHTPGPWVAFDYSDMPHPDDLGPWFVIGPREFHTVAEVRPGNSDDGLPAQTPANARLIAAAPEMLAALRDVCLILDAAHEAGASVNPAHMPAAMRNMRAAIARAEGRA